MYKCTLCSHQGSLRHSIIITLNFIWTFLALPIFSRGIMISLERWFASQFSDLLSTCFHGFSTFMQPVPRGALMLQPYLIRKVKISWHCILSIGKLILSGLIPTTFLHSITRHSSSALDMYSGTHSWAEHICWAFKSWVSKQIDVTELQRYTSARMDVD